MAQPRISAHTEPATRPRVSPLGLSVVIAFATGLLLALMGYQVATWQKASREGAALVVARALADGASRVDVSSDVGETVLQRAVAELATRVPDVRTGMILSGTRFVAHSDPELAGTRLQRDNLEHKALYDDSKALQQSLTRNQEEHEKYPDLVKNPYPTSLVRAEGQQIYVAVPILRGGDVDGMVALLVESAPFDIGGVGLQLSLAGAGLIALTILLARFAPGVPQPLIGVAFMGAVSGIVLLSVGAGTDAMKTQVGTSAIHSVGVWTDLVHAGQEPLAETPPAPVSLGELVKVLNQDTSGNPMALFEEISSGELSGAGVLNAEGRSVRFGAAMQVSATWAWRGLGVVLAGVALYLAMLITGWTRRISVSFVEHWYAYAYVSPAVLGTALLVFGPFIFGIALGFYTRVYTSYEFVGLQNFIDILSDFSFTRTRNFYRTLAVTVMWTAVNVSLHVSIGLGLAMILKDKTLRFTPIYRTLLVVPWALPNYITALIWKGMFNKEYGVVNTALAAVGIEPVSWFNSFWGAFTANLVTNVWLGFPFMMVISLGALQSIPSELYEAADVDGAGRWDKFRRITVPLLKPALFPAIILGTIWTFNQFNVIYLVSGGAPDGATDILITEAYRWAFEGRQQFGYAASYSTIIFLILFGYTYVTNKITKSTEGAFD